MRDIGDPRFAPLFGEAHRRLRAPSAKAFLNGGIACFLKLSEVGGEIAAEIGAGNWAQFLLKFVISHPALTGPQPDADLRKRMSEAFDAL